MNEKVNLAEKFTKFHECWSPKIIDDLNDSYVKVAKFQFITSYISVTRR